MLLLLLPLQRITWTPRTDCAIVVAIVGVAACDNAYGAGTRMTAAAAAAAVSLSTLG